MALSPLDLWSENPVAIFCEPEMLLSACRWQPRLVSAWAVSSVRFGSVMPNTLQQEFLDQLSQQCGPGQHPDFSIYFSMSAFLPRPQFRIDVQMPQVVATYWASIPISNPFLIAKPIKSEKMSQAHKLNSSH